MSNFKSWADITRLRLLNDKPDQKRNKFTRKVNRNTYVERDQVGGDIHLRLHRTRIVTYRRDGGISIDMDGWNTMITTDRIAKYTPFWVRNYDGEWFVVVPRYKWSNHLHRDDHLRFPYEDGITLYSTGTDYRAVSGDGKREIEHAPQNMFSAEGNFRLTLIGRRNVTLHASQQLGLEAESKGLRREPVEVPTDGLRRQSSNRWQWQRKRELVATLQERFPTRYYSSITSKLKDMPTALVLANKLETVLAEIGLESFCKDTLYWVDEARVRLGLMTKKQQQKRSEDRVVRRLVPVLFGETVGKSEQ